ncbi:MAG: hypothetical protein AAGF94_00465 [Pseudomonadota bacterium]
MTRVAAEDLDVQFGKVTGQFTLDHAAIRQITRHNRESTGIIFALQVPPNIDAIEAIGEQRRNHDLWREASHQTTSEAVELSVNNWQMGDFTAYATVVQRGPVVRHHNFDHQDHTHFDQYSFTSASGLSLLSGSLPIRLLYELCFRKVNKYKLIVTPYLFLRAIF